MDNVKTEDFMYQKMNTLKYGTSLFSDPQG
jgi:hypothetical protein